MKGLQGLNRAWPGYLDRETANSRPRKSGENTEKQTKITSIWWKDPLMFRNGGHCVTGHTGEPGRSKTLKVLFFNSGKELFSVGVLSTLYAHKKSKDAAGGGIGGDSAQGKEVE